MLPLERVGVVFVAALLITLWRTAGSLFRQTYIDSFSDDWSADAQGTAQASQASR